MALPRSTSRRLLLRKLRRLGFEGPVSTGSHAFMRRGKFKLKVPNEHAGDIDISLLREILRQAGISDEDYMNA